MRTVFYIHLILGLLVAAPVSPARAHSPYYSNAESLPAAGRGNVSIKLLNGDGIFFADPMRAVVTDEHGNLLAVSPVSEALTLVCTSHDPQRTCIVYDELSRMIYEPNPDQWQNVGVIEENGRPIQYPEYGMAEFGFTQRAATVAETLRAEFAGAIQSWPSTAIAIAWWMLFGLLFLPVVQRLVRRGRRPGLASIVIRLIAAALMIPITAYAWLLKPYSEFYLASVLIIGALLAWPVNTSTNRLRHHIASDR